MIRRKRTKTAKTTGKALASWEIEVEGIPVRVTCKQVKNMRLRIDEADLAVLATAPPHASRSELEAFIRSSLPVLERSRQRLAASPAHRAANASSKELSEYRELVAACVPALVEAWEPIMGVKAGELTYRNMKSRWGSCQPSTGRICINTRLALYPPECLEYVVVHELNHLLHPDHSAAFHADMDRFMPDWRERRRKLQG